MSNQQIPDQTPPSQIPKGVIYDAGYREYTGEYQGRFAAIASLIWDDVKRALGIKRSWVYKLFLYIILLGQFGIFLFMFLSDFLINETFGALQGGEAIREALGDETIRYYSFFSLSTTLLWFLSALGAPWLMCQERKNKVLPLYFSRPIKPMDYLLAKGVAIFGLLFVFSAVPVILLFFAKVGMASDAIAYLGENANVLLAIIASAAIISVFYASFSMGIASLVESPGFAAGGIIGVPFIIGSLFGILVLITGDPLIQLVNFPNSVTQLITWVFLGEIPIVNLERFDASTEGFEGNFVSANQPLAIWIYALQTVVISLLGWLISFWVYRKETSR